MAAGSLHRNSRFHCGWLLFASSVSVFGSNIHAPPSLPEPGGCIAPTHILVPLTAARRCNLSRSGRRTMISRADSYP